MNKQNGSDGELKIWFADDIPEDVLVDEVTEEVLAAAPQGQSWGPHPPFRQPEGVVFGDEEGAEAPEKPRPAAGGLVRILLLPVTAVRAFFRFILYSGMTKRSALAATLRLLAAFIPIFIVIYLSYLNLSRLFPTYSQVSASHSRLVEADENQVRFTIGSTQLGVPLPEGFSVIPLDEFHRDFPLTAEAAMADNATVVFAARSTVPNEESYFATVAADNETAGSRYTDAQFSRVLHGNTGLVAVKDIQGSMQLGPNQVIPPFDPLPSSVSYGRMMHAMGTGQKSPSTLRQYSCFMLHEGKAIVITIGYSYSSDSGKAGSEARCKTVLAAWRDSIQGKP